MESEDKRPVFTKRLIFTILVVILIIIIIILLLKRCGNGNGYRVVGITAQPTVLNLAVGESQKIYAQVEPSDAKNQGYTCTSMNTAVASVDSSCTVTGVGDGTTTILVVSDDGGKTTEVTVNVGPQAGELTGILLSPKTYTVNVGRTKLVTVKAIPESANLPELIYTVANPAIAKVNSLGKIEGLKVGKTTLTVSTKDGKFTDTATIYVVKRSNQPTTCPSGQVLQNGSCVTPKIKPTKITVSPTSKTITIGDSFKPTITISPSNADKTVTCMVSDTKVLGESNCKLTGLKAGKATVNICVPNSKLCATLTVTVKAKDPTSIMLKELTKTIYVGDTYKPKYTIYPTGASQDITCTIATADQKYLTQSSCTLKGVAPGKVNVNVCAKANKKICALLVVTVKAQKPTKITLNPTSKTIKVGETYKPKFTITPSGANQAITCTIATADQKKLTQSGCTLKGVAAGKVKVKVCAKDDSSICATLTMTIEAASSGGSSGGSGSGGSSGGSGSGGSSGSGGTTKTCPSGYTNNGSNCVRTYNATQGNSTGSQIVASCSSYYINCYRVTCEAINDYYYCKSLTGSGTCYKKITTTCTYSCPQGGTLSGTTCTQYANYLN